MGDVIVMTNGFFAVGTGTASADRDLSDRMKNITFTQSFDDHDVTTMGSTTRVRTIGLGEAEIQAEFMQSYATNDAGENIDKLVDTLVGVSQSGGKFLVRAKPYKANRTGTNPEYTMLCVLAERTVLDAEVGDPLLNPITFLSAGDLTRATATT